MNKHKARNPKVAIFDYSVRSDSAMGGCHLRMLAGLCHDYDFTVFAIEFENPDLKRIQFVRIPVPTRPTILLAILYHLLAPLYYVAYRVKHKVRFDLVEKMEVFTFLGSVAYIHFCYRAYLGKHWSSSKQPGIRGMLLTLDQGVRAYILEPIIYRLSKRLVVPSHGLARELVAAYPFTSKKVSVLPNAVDYDRLSNPPTSFVRETFRLELGFAPADLVLVFVALGQFERKGLPQLLQGVAEAGATEVKVLVVGGSSHWIEEYRASARQLGIADRVVFVGMQRNVAPYLWASDAFCVPSNYETFLLVGIESAAAGLPLIVPRLNGVEDYLKDGENGMLIERTPESIAAAIHKLIALGSEGRRQFGEAAQRAARDYSAEAFVARWDQLLRNQINDGPPTVDLKKEHEHAST